MNDLTENKEVNQASSTSDSGNTTMTAQETMTPGFTSGGLRNEGG